MVGKYAMHGMEEKAYSLKTSRCTSIKKFSINLGILTSSYRAIIRRADCEFCVTSKVVSWPTAAAGHSDGAERYRTTAIEGTADVISISSALLRFGR